VALAAWLCFSGCGAPNVTERIEDFHDRVQAALGVGSQRTEYVAHGRFLPRDRERRLEVRDERIGVLTFLSLQGCRLGELAGFRNSPLGRVMVGTRQLAYETEVLAVGEPCAVGLADSEERAELLALLGRKRAELPSRVWNAVWTDSPLDVYLGSEEPPRADAWDTYGLGALRRVSHAASRVDSPEDARRLEEALGSLRFVAPAGGLLRAIDRVRHELDGLAELLESEVMASCTTAARRAARVFASAYPGIQVQLSQLDRVTRGALEQLDRIYASTAAGVVPPLPMQRYAARKLDFRSEAALFGRYREAVARHAEAWGPVLAMCGVLPGS
jgi:hypothetical protein